MEAYVEQGTAGQIPCQDGAAAKPLCQEPKLLKDAGLPPYWEALKGEDMVGSMGIHGSPLWDPENASRPCQLQHGQPVGTPSMPSWLPQITTHPPRDHHPSHNHCQCSPSTRAPCLIHPPGKLPSLSHTESPPCTVLLSARVPHASWQWAPEPSCPNLHLMEHMSHSLTTMASQVTLKLALAFPKGRQNHPGDNLLGEGWEPLPRSCSRCSCALWSSPKAVFFQLWFKVLPLFH